MTSQITIKATHRASTGEGTSKGRLQALRKSGSVPAVVYGKKGSVSVAIDAKSLPKGHTKAQLVHLDIEGAVKSVLMREVQVNPLSDLPVHIDFHEIDPSDVVKAHVPLEFVGLSREQEKEGSFKILLRSIEVSGVAKSLPVTLKVNVGHLKVDESAHLSDCELPADLKIKAQKSLALASLVKL